MKYFWFVLLLSLAGCGSVAPPDKVKSADDGNSLYAWVGSPEEDIIMRWGEPEAVDSVFGMRRLSYPTIVYNTTPTVVHYFRSGSNEVKNVMEYSKSDSLHSVKAFAHFQFLIDASGNVASCNWR